MSIRKPESTVAVQAVLDVLNPLLGSWKGQGKGTYPTLDDFDYSETLVIRHNPGASFFTYQQDTEITDSEGKPIRKSHWEAGVLRPLEDGSIELVCVQGSGRVEVLRGEILTDTTYPEMLILQFESKLIGNDNRVKNASRSWILNENQLKYLMKMATSKVEELSLHLEATLIKD